MSKRTDSLTEAWIKYLRYGGKNTQQVTANYKVQMYYNFNNLFSYNTLLAKKVETIPIIELYVDTKECSNTSREHFYSVQYYCKPHGFTPIVCVSTGIQETLKWYITGIEAYLTKQTRARTVNYLPFAAGLLYDLQAYFIHKKDEVTAAQLIQYNNIKKAYEQQLMSHNIKEIYASNRFE